MQIDSTLIKQFKQQPKALIIAPPWAGMIVKGEKVWEMRKAHTQFRGIFAVAEKGTGTLLGLVNLNNSSGPHSIEYLLENQASHCGAAEQLLAPGFAYNYAWELSGAFKFQTPIPYTMKSGAVSWVNLSSDDLQRVIDSLGACNEEIGSRSDTQAAPRSEPAARDHPTIRRRKAVLTTTYRKPPAGPVEVDAITQPVTDAGVHQTESLTETGKRRGLLVPMARDGTCFDSVTCSNKGTYRVGEKGNEKQFKNYHEALEYLKTMKTATWRRPNANGNWGGVKAVKWVER